jgi:hypothetical protein
MDYVSKDVVLNNLNKEWKNFLIELISLKDDEKTKYLNKQGYPNNCALLGHIIGWWNEAYINIGKLITNPDYKSPEYDVDKFNANIIEKVKGREEQNVIEEYEALRSALFELISTIQEKRIDIEEMQKELYWNITNHYKDHKIK